MDRDISRDTTNLLSIEMSSSLAKHTNFVNSQEKLSKNPAINIQIDDMKNNNSRTLPTNSPKPNQVHIQFTHLKETI